MSLSRQPRPWSTDLNVDGSVIHDSSVLCDGTLCLYIKIGKGWKREEWRQSLEALFSDFFEHVQKHKICFALLIHIEADSGVTPDAVAHVNNHLKKKRNVIMQHLKGTIVILPNPVYEIIILSALALLPPLKPFDTKVCPTLFSGNKWNLVPEMHEEMIKWVLSLPWPDEKM